MIFFSFALLSDAEIPEDGVEGVIGGDVACDFGEIVDALVEVEGYDVAGGVGVGELVFYLAD